MDESIGVEPRPYRMHNQIQHYAWGARGEGAFIPHLLGIPPEPDVPYAELWMGTHPKAPSRIELPDGTIIPLDAWIARAPERALGSEVVRTFGELPFLFKVLSAAEPLSIQAHPDKAQAVRLHAKDPEHYPDDNHKPEVAIAVDELTALIGFKPFAELCETLDNYPEIADFVGASAVSSFEAETLPDVEAQRARTYELFAALIRRAHEDPDALADAVDALTTRLANTFEGLIEVELRFLDLQEKYGSRDVGLFVLFLLNLVRLGPGEGVVLPAGVPHAYLHGNIVECMANSDNVVRVGLTPKFKDAETLLEIVDTTLGVPPVIRGDQHVEIVKGVISGEYHGDAREFEVRRWVMAGGTEITVRKENRPAILLIIDGNIGVGWGGEQHQPFHHGESIFLPACLEDFTIHSIDGAELFQAEVPPQS